MCSITGIQEGIRQLVASSAHTLLWIKTMLKQLAKALRRKQDPTRYTGWSPIPARMAEIKNEAEPSYHPGRPLVIDNYRMELSCYVTYASRPETHSHAMQNAQERLNDMLFGEIKSRLLDIQAAVFAHNERLALDHIAELLMDLKDPFDLNNG